MALQSDVDGLQQRRADETPTRADGGWGGSVAAHLMRAAYAHLQVYEARQHKAQDQ